MAKDPKWYKPVANGPYPWGSGPQPKKKCACMDGTAAIRRGKVRLGARLIRIGVKHRLGVM